jgi:hypothetical protein
MKVVLDIRDDTRIPFFMELLNSLDYVKVLKEIKNKKNSQYISDLAEAFHEVDLHSKGKLKLKRAKDVLNEMY